MNSLIDREVEIFQGRGPRRRQHLPSSLASKPLAHIPLQEPFQKGLQLRGKGIRELHVLWRKETQRDAPWWKRCALPSCLCCLKTALPRAARALRESRGGSSSFRGNGSSGNTGISLSPYHGERHPVDLVLIFGFVLPERAVPVERRKRMLINKCQASAYQGISAVAMPGKSGASC